MRKTGTILFLFFLSVLMHAQNNFIPGSITKLDGTILKGDINFQDWKRSPKQIEFRNGDGTITFSPERLLGFTVGEETYISRLTSLDVTEQNLNKMHPSTPVEFMDVHIFLRQLVEGNINLYEYFDYRSHYFFEKDDVFRELNYREMLTDNLKLKPQKTFIGQLNLLLSDCQDVHVKESMSYKKEQLVKLINEYNHCGDQTYVYKKKSEIENGSGAFIGVGVTKLNLNTESSESAFVNYSPENNMSINFGGFYELFINKDLKKWSVLGELGFFTVKGDTEYSHVYFELFDYHNRQQFEYQISSVDFNLLIRYRFNTNNQKLIPFLGGGVGVNFTSGNLEVFQTKDGSDGTNHYKFEPRKMNFGLSLGAGLEVSKFALELRYGFVSKVFSFADSSDLQTFMLRAYYNFN